MIAVEPRTLPRLLSVALEAFGDRPAFVRVEGSSLIPKLNYTGFGLAVQRFAALLVSQGIQKGERVMILCENRYEWAIAYFGILEVQAVVVPVLVDFTSEQVDNVARHAAVRLVCASEKTLPKLKAALTETASAKVASSTIATLPVLMLDSLNEEGIDIVVNDTRACIALPPASIPAASLRDTPLVADDLACIIYTSGTSGHSKGVMLTHGNLVSNTIATRAVFPLRENDRVLSVMPLAHTLESTMGLLTPVLNGSCVYYLDKPPAAPVLAAALQAVKPTVMVIVPLIIEKLYHARVEGKLKAHPLYRFAPTRSLAIHAAGRKLEAAFGGELRFLGIGGAALARDVEEFLLAARFPYAIGYGLTETSPLIAAAIPGNTRLGSTGIILEGLEVRIAVPEGADAEDPGKAQAIPVLAAIGAEGEIQVRGPSVMQGYYQDAERTAAVFTPDHWFRTGDLGTFDADAKLYVRGRLKAMILGSSGENIYPEEIESTLAATGLVEESLVYAAKDGALVALVVLNERAKALAEEAEQLLTKVRTAANARLASFSRLARIIVQDEPFEKTATLKIKRYLYPRLKGQA